MAHSLLPDKLYYSIAELSDHFGVAKSLLRYWEQEFPSINPKRNKKGVRFYTKKDVEHIRMIHHLVKEQGHTLDGARQQLSKRRKKVESTVEIKESLLKIRGYLTELRDQI